MEVMDYLHLGLMGRDWPDVRDWRLHEVAQPKLLMLGVGEKKLPEKYRKEREKLPPVWDQGALGSCGLHAGMLGVGALQIAGDGEMTMLSRLQWYWATRERMGVNIAEDTGIRMRDMLKALKLYGAAPEEMWPYDIDRFTEEPAARIWAVAQNYQGLRFIKLPEPSKTGPAAIDEIRMFLYKGDAIPIFGMAVFRNSFGEAAHTGVLPMPKRTDKFVGGHAVGAVGWEPGHLRIRNSHGIGFGDDGEFVMPIEYACEYTFDWWGIVETEYLKYEPSLKDEE